MPHVQHRLHRRRRQAAKDFLAEARAFRAAAGAESLEAAGREVFSLISSTLSESDRIFARDLAASGVIRDVGALGESFAALRTAMPIGSPEAFEDLTDQELAAIAIAPAQAPQIPAPAARAAGSADALGLQSEGLFAATAILARANRDANVAGTQADALFRGIEKSGVLNDRQFKDLEGFERLDALLGGDLTPDQLRDRVGDEANVVRAARFLRANLDELRTQRDRIAKADEESLARQAISLPDVDPTLRAARLAERSQAAKEIAEQTVEGSSRLQNIFDSASNERATNRALGTETETETGDFLADAISRALTFTDI